jgi:hypothetical protein
MRCSLVLLGLVVACGGDPVRHIADAPPAPQDAPIDTAVDAPLGPPACTMFVATTSTETDVMSFAFSGGTFESFGCAPIDPTYWLSGAGMSATVTFATPQTYPSIRVWGMNTDDTAAISVNGNAYPLDATSASLAEKVVCGLSPGPDGMAFVDGALTGANTSVDGNYSYQDVMIKRAGVTTIQITGLTGNGWGLAGASAACISTPN